MTKEELRNVRAGDFLTTKHGNIILVEHVEFTEGGKPCVYPYFDYDNSVGIQMNEWLRGYYGPKFNDDSYRLSTDEEKQFFLDKLKEYGYELSIDYGVVTPRMTYGKFCQHKCKQELSLPESLDEAAHKYAWERQEHHIDFDGDEYLDYGPRYDAFKAGATWRDAQIPKLPDDVDEAAEERAQRAYDDPTAMGYAKRLFFKSGFKAGAEWMAGQGISVTAITGIKDGITEEALDKIDDFIRKANPEGTEVIIQIRKKD